MPKVVLTSEIKDADTIETINEPVTVTATLTSGVQVTVPANTAPGAIVLLNADGSAPTAVLVEGDNLFSAENATAELTVVG